MNIPHTASVRTLQCIIRLIMNLSLFTIKLKATDCKGVGASLLLPSLTWKLGIIYLLKAPKTIDSLLCYCYVYHCAWSQETQMARNFEPQWAILGALIRRYDVPNYCAPPRVANRLSFKLLYFLECDWSLGKRSGHATLEHDTRKVFTLVWTRFLPRIFFQAARKGRRPAKVPFTK